MPKTLLISLPTVESGDSNKRISYKRQLEHIFEQQKDDPVHTEFCHQEKPEVIQSQDKPDAETSEHTERKKRPFGTHQTKTKNTEKQYEHRSMLLFRAIEKTLPPETPIGPLETLEHLRSIAPSKTNATIRLYRAALIHTIQKNTESGLYQKSESDHAIAEMRKITGAIKSGQTSSRKAKSASEKNIERLISKLETTSGYGAKTAKAIFMATLVTGLRPNEWFNVSVTVDNENSDTDKSLTLEIKNSKNTNGRASGDTRKLKFVNAANINLITEALDLIEIARSLGKTDAAIYRNIRSCINNMDIKNQSRKKITLYTARHQFSANMKNIASVKDVAGMLGHGSDKTAQNHYGRKTSGHKSFVESGKNRDSQTNALTETQETTIHQ